MKSLLLGILLPVSLLSAPNNPGAGLCGTDGFAAGLAGSAPPSYYISVLSQTGFVKENGHYYLQGGLRHKKDMFSLGYGFEGYSLLHTQKASLSYARLFMPGLSAGIGMGYGFANAVEGRRRAQNLYPGFNLFYQRNKWGLGFVYKQTVCLNPLQKKEWNEALSLQLCGNLKLYEGLWLGADVQKDIRYPVCVSAGLSYLLKDRFLIWLQAQVNPVKYKVGFGYYHRWFQVELACTYQTPLGFESAVGVAFRWGNPTGWGNTTKRKQP